MLYSSISELLESSKMGLLAAPSACTVAELCEALSIEETELQVFLGSQSGADTGAKGFWCGFETNDALMTTFSEWMQVGSEINSEDLAKDGAEAGEAGEAGPDFDIDEVINGLVDMFKEQNGRDPTEDEIRIWLDQIKSASGGDATAAAAGAGEEGAVPAAAVDGGSA
jgi:hypothetical protein